MQLEQALAIARELLAPEHLNSAQEMVFIESWSGKSYSEMVQDGGYDVNYIRGVGSQLWRSLGTATAERVSKNNFRQIIERLTLAPTVDVEVINPTAIAPASIPPCLAGYPDDVSVFYGRKIESQQLTSWIVEDRCRVVTILGMGGIGKTSLVRQVVRSLAGEFRCILWRSLLNAPLLSELLPDLFRVAIDRLGLDITDPQWQRFSLSDAVSVQLELLLELLQQHRCAIILDNCESLFQSKRQVGQYREGYANYGELFTLIGRYGSQSCLILTSREKPVEISLLAGVNGQVRTLLLSELDRTSGEQIFLDRGCLPMSMSIWTEINRYYGGNPLIFQLVAAVIQDIADGDVREILPHLKSGQLLADIELLLDRQWERLTASEYQVMYWLAIHHKPIDLASLEASLHPTWNRQADTSDSGTSLLTILQSLRRRSLICLAAAPSSQWYLAPLVAAYVKSKFVSLICTEIELQQPALLNTHALMRSTDPEYLRHAQLQSIIEPIISQIRNTVGCPAKIGDRLKQMLADWQKAKPLSPGYVAGNLLNLLIYLQQDLTNLDCSELVIWQGYFVGIELSGVNFAQAQMMNCVFTQTCNSELNDKAAPPD